jgi:hypothetical protein
MQVLEDESLLVLWNYAIAYLHGDMVMHYSVAGATLNTYDFASYAPDYDTSNGLALDVTSGIFWVCLQLDQTGLEPYPTRFLKIRASDGVVITDIEPYVYLGESGIPIPALDSPHYFGPNYYGPFIIIRQAIGELLSQWVDVADFIEQEVSDSDFANGIARVRCKLWTRDSGVMVKARLYDVINGVSVGESAEIISQTPVDATFSVILTTGVTRYHLQLTSDTVESDLFAMGAGLIS